jgi:diphthamide biosynthesis protein 7
MKRCVFSTHLGGGVWRLKWDPHGCQRIVTACMHAGFCVLDYTDKTKPPSIVATYKEHQSLAYGSDWCHLLGEEAIIYVKDQVLQADGAAQDLRIVASCSFYDHKLCVSFLNE